MSVIFTDWAHREVSKCLKRYKTDSGTLKTCQRRAGHKGKCK